MDALEHRLHLLLHPCLEVPHVDAHEVCARLDYRLIYSLLAEVLSFFDVFDHEGRYVSFGKFKYFFEAVCVEVKRGGFMIDLRDEEDGLGLLDGFRLLGDSGAGDLFLLLGG